MSLLYIVQFPSVNYAFKNIDCLFLMPHDSNLFVDSAEEYLDPLYKLEEMCKVRQEVAGMTIHYTGQCGQA